MSNLIHFALKIKKILVSQPAPTTDKSPYFDLSEKHSLKVDFRPFIQVEEIPGKEFKTDKVDILSHTAVIITSKTAVNNFFRVAKEMKISIPDSLKYFCTSEAIALYLQKYITYRKRKIFFGKRTFDDLMELIQKHKQEKFLFPLSEVHKPDMPGKLDKAKIKYSKAILYRTVSADLSDLKEVDYDILVFFSPTGIASLQENFPDFTQNGTKIASFGATTAQAVKDAGLRLDIQVPTKKAPSMSMALDNFIKEELKKK